MNYLETCVTTKTNILIKIITLLIIIMLTLTTFYTIQASTVNEIASSSDKNISDIEPVLMNTEKLESDIKNLIIEEVKAQEPVVPTLMASRELSTQEINSYTDLSYMRSVTVDDLNIILNYWSNVSGSQVFVNQGQVFFDAAIQSGLDPVYLIAHAGLESSWGKSEIAVDKFNYFGIGSFDHNPYHGSYTMGSSLYDGIVEGAKWIRTNFYDAGQTSLYTMRYNNGSHEYCTSTTWVDEITNIIITSYNLLN